MTPTERAEINRKNAARSTGPRSPEGRSRSKMNAVKHGMTARTPVLPGEDPDAFRARLDSWAEALVPADAVEQFLVEQAATASWKIERADRIESTRLFAALRAAEDEQRAGRRKEAAHLGRLLLGIDGPADPALAQEVLRILDLGHSAPPADRLVPLRPIIDHLELTAEECAWLLECWSELRDPLEKGTDWDEDRSVRAVQLSGRQPLNLPPEHWKIHVHARYFGGDEELEPSGGEELDEERQLALDALIIKRVQAEDCREMARQLVEDLPEDEAQARSALLGVVDRAIGRLTALAAAHEARWEAGAVERAQRMTFDPGPDDELVWRHQFGCGRSMQRMLGTLLKLRREDRAAGRAAGREEGRSAAPPDAQNEAISQADAPPSCSPERLTNERHPLLGVNTRPGPQPPLTLPSQGGEDRGTCASFPPLASLGVDTGPGPQPPLTLPSQGGENRGEVRLLSPPCKGGVRGGLLRGAMQAIGARDEAAAPVAATSPPQDEAAAPAVDQTPVPDEAATALVAASSPQNEATDQAVERTPVIDDATAPPLADRPSPQNEATNPTRGAAREVSMVLVTALALLSSAGLAAAFGRSTDVTPRPSPISAHEPRGPRTTLPGGDPRGLGTIPPEDGPPHAVAFDTALTLPPRAATLTFVVGPRPGNRRSAHGLESSHKGSLAPLAVAF